jgi:hypothetical protein
MSLLALLTRGADQPYQAGRPSLEIPVVIGKCRTRVPKGGNAFMVIIISVWIGNVSVHQ